MPDTSPNTSAVSAPQPLVQVDALTKRFWAPQYLGGGNRRVINAVNNVTFTIHAGECFGLVGESGSGKTTLSRLLLRVLDPTAGRITFAGEDITTATGAALRRFRRRTQMIMQNPYESLNPRLTVCKTVTEPLTVHRLGSKAERIERAEAVLNKVGLAPGAAYLYRYPHELSGGQRQRVAIARALAPNPLFVAADEPVSMLDASSGAGILRLLAELREALQVSFLYITHDLVGARCLCDRIAVMYAGRIIEMAGADDVLCQPQHPYTRALLAAVPRLQAQAERKMISTNGKTTQGESQPHCSYYHRCPLACARCASDPHPELVEKAAGHLVACHCV